MFPNCGVLAVRSGYRKKCKTLVNVDVEKCELKFFATRRKYLLIEALKTLRGLEMVC